MPRVALIGKHSGKKKRTVTDFDRQTEDWYIEPAWCVEQLIQAVNFRGTIHDPCCGSGTIPKVFG